MFSVRTFCNLAVLLHDCPGKSLVYVIKICLSARHLVKLFTSRFGFPFGPMASVGVEADIYTYYLPTCCKTWILLLRPTWKSKVHK